MKGLSHGQVSRHLLGPELPGSGEPCNVGSSSVDDSLQHLANQLRSSYSRASELTQQALQIGTKQVRCCKAMPLVSALIRDLHRTSSQNCHPMSQSACACVQHSWLHADVEMNVITFTEHSTRTLLPAALLICQAQVL